MDEKGLELASSICGGLFVVFMLVLVLFPQTLAADGAAVREMGGTSLLVVGGFLLTCVGIAHRSFED